MHSQQAMNCDYDQKRGFHPGNASGIIVANDVGVRQQTLWRNPMVNDHVNQRIVAAEPEDLLSKIVTLQKDGKQKVM